MNKLYVDKWFKMPPKASEKVMSIEIKEAGHGRKSRKKTKKKTSKKSG